LGFSNVHAGNSSDLQVSASTESQLLETQSAFDSVAADYDGPRGNNELIQEMRGEMWRWLEKTFPTGSRLLDLGCGTGLDAVYLATRGHTVVASDWSPAMIERTRRRAAEQNVAERVIAANVGAHQLQFLNEPGQFDGVYSNLGPLNCVPDIAHVARECARLVKPGGALVFTVIGRYCPWEVAHYLRRKRWARAKVRLARSVVPVGMNNHTIWTRYYSPGEFYNGFASHFSLQHVRGICVFAPPPYITSFRQKHPRLLGKLWALDRVLAGLPMIRTMGDHFLIVMKKR
jgi:ubiquinone/menaquinone biosynthesis C-methylase UbiE